MGGRRNITKRATILILVLAAVVIVALVFVLVNRGELEKTPWNTRFDFRYPYFAVLDSQDNIYLIDDGSKRITKMDSRGRVLYTMRGGSRDRGSFYYAIRLAVDEADRLYVLNATPNLIDGSTEREEILRYLPDGRFERALVAFDHPLEVQAEIGGSLAVLGMQISGGGLYYGYDSGGAAEYHRLDLALETDQTLFAVSSDRGFVDVAGTDRANALFTRKSGTIFRPGGASGGRDDESYVRPVGVVSDGQGGVYVSDLVRQGIYRTDAVGQTTPVLTRDTLRRGGLAASNLLIEFFHLRSDGSITAVDRYGKSIIVMGRNGELKAALSSGADSGSVVLLRVLVWAALILGGAGALLLGGLVYTSLMKGRFPIILKHIVVFSPLILGSVVIIGNTVYTQIYGRYSEEVAKGLQATAYLGSRLIDGDTFETVDDPRDFGGEAYLRIRDQMHDVLNGNTDPWNASLFAALYIVRDGVYYYTYTSSEYYGVMYPYFEIQGEHREAFESGKTGITRYYDESGGYLAAVAPIRSSGGRIAGVMEIGLSLDIFDEINGRYARSLALGVVVTMALFILAFGAITYLLLISVRLLRNAVNLVANGNLDVSTHVRSRDEIGDLGRDFNTMSSQLKTQITEIVDLNRANSRFVPSEFLTKLNRQSILHIRLGDQVQREMTVLFSDIRSFTTLSESMSPKENFDFLNAYLRRMGPIIRENGGFIDKYIGDAIMALFPDNPESAVRAGIMMRKKLDEYNKHRAAEGWSPIAIGVGIHTGSLMMGIIGEEERFDGTVISDAVNLASRIEGLTKMYEAFMIVSEQSFTGMRDTQWFPHRFLDSVIVKGKREPVSLYEVLDGDETETGRRKIRTCKAFANAITRYRRREFAEALRIFLGVHQLNPGDKSAVLYAKRCESFLKNGVPDRWNGAVEILAK